MNVFYIHWNEAEYLERIRGLHADDIKITGGCKSGVHEVLLKQLPDVLVISLDRLPSHGKAIARWMWEAKKRQTIPIIFEGGSEEKTVLIRKEFPRAIFVQNGQVMKAIDEIMKRP